MGLSSLSLKSPVVDLCLDRSVVRKSEYPPREALALSFYGNAARLAHIRPHRYAVFDLRCRLSAHSVAFVLSVFSYGDTNWLGLSNPCSALKIPQLDRSFQPQLELFGTRKTCIVSALLFYALPFSTHMKPGIAHPRSSLFGRALAYSCYALLYPCCSRCCRRSGCLCFAPA